MNQISFFFPDLHPFSTNESVKFTRKGKYYKSTAKKTFQDLVYFEMIKHKPEIFQFEKHYSIYENVLVGSLYVFMPRNKLITKKDYINMKSGDVNNNKVFTDAVFKHFEKLDDCHLISEPPFKLISPDDKYSMAYTLDIYGRDDLEKWSSNAWEKINTDHLP